MKSIQNILKHCQFSDSELAVCVVAWLNHVTEKYSFKDSPIYNMTNAAFNKERQTIALLKKRTKSLSS